MTQTFPSQPHLPNLHLHLYQEGELLTSFLIPPFPFTETFYINEMEQEVTLTGFYHLISTLAMAEEVDDYIISTRPTAPEVFPK